MKTEVAEELVTTDTLAAYNEEFDAATTASCDKEFGATVTLTNEEFDAATLA